VKGGHRAGASTAVLRLGGVRVLRRIGERTSSFDIGRSEHRADLGEEAKMCTSVPGPAMNGRDDRQG
jgi:hypothetical protein